MRILLVNEEGCFAPGIVALAKVLSVKHRVVIVAPLHVATGVGHTFTKSAAPLHVRQFYKLAKIKIFSVDGTPCDCVTLALDKVLKSRPDLIISGIDGKNNRGETIFTSGVVSAAIEGTIQGIPSISLSFNSKDAEGTKELSFAEKEKEFMAVARAFERHLTEFINLIQPEITLNINFPANYSKRLIKYTRATDGLIDNKYRQEVNPFGTMFYWLTSPKMGFGLDALEQKGDLYWLKRNYITVTPLKLDLTNYEVIPTLEKAGLKL